MMQSPSQCPTSTRSSTSDGRSRSWSSRSAAHAAPGPEPGAGAGGFDGIGTRTGGYCTTSPAVLPTVRPKRQRVPVRRLIPTRRHASALLTHPARSTEQTAAVSPTAHDSVADVDPVPSQPPPTLGVTTITGIRRPAAVEPEQFEAQIGHSNPCWGSLDLCHCHHKNLVDTMMSTGYVHTTLVRCNLLDRDCHVAYAPARSCLSHRPSAHGGCGHRFGIEGSRTAAKYSKPWNLSSQTPPDSTTPVTSA